jgi:regulator of nucleoside diphosphate kinase
MLNRRPIMITAEDFAKLQALVSSKLARAISAPEHLDDLQAELNRAEVVEGGRVDEDVVTMDSVVMLRDLDTDETETYTLVYPNRADIANDKLSVLAPIGTAILGYRVGDELNWRVPSGWRRLRVEQVLFQPERDGPPQANRPTAGALPAETFGAGQSPTELLL